MTRLTPHFTLEELSHSDTAIRLGIDNTPPEALVPNLRLVACGLEDVRDVLGGRAITVHSGYRCEALERVLCAKDFAGWCARHSVAKDEDAWKLYFARKAHPRGWAVDWSCPSFGRPAEIVRVLQAKGPKVDQLIEEGTWVHTSFDPRLRGEVLTARFGPDGTPTYSKAA